MTTFKKGELEALYAEKFEVGKGEAKKQLNEVFGFFEEILVEHQAGFKFGDVGTFEVNPVEKKTHTRRNPQTGEEFEQTVDAHLALKFKISKGKNSVREKLKK